MNIIKRNYISFKDALNKIVHNAIQFFRNCYKYLKCYIMEGHDYEYVRSYTRTWQEADDECYIVRTGYFDEYRCKHCGYTIEKTVRIK